ncbi:MAG: serine hydrolase [Candidatus Acetothermia bacterium]|jgi:CubicO group peptidase (beta-lactamase class C family)|nr:serine hydrolase [Candidatus Acetothermia bacterium]
MTCLPEAADPRDVGMDPGRLGRIDAVIEAAIAAGTIPGAVVLVTRSGKVVKHTSYGMAMEIPEQRPMCTATIFDLASLTKVVVTVPLSLMLVEQGLWNLRDPVARFFPQLGWGDQVTILHLLTHTAGLPPWMNLFYLGRGRDRVLELLCSHRWPVPPLTQDPGRRVIYSDLGYILVGAAIEKVTGEQLDVLASTWLFTPLGMSDTMFNPRPELVHRIAATERDPNRGGVLVGTVHDENAWAMDGVAGHAGLFSTAKDVAIYAQTLLNGGVYGEQKLLSPRSVEVMTSPHTEGLNERRGLGWMLQGPGTLSAGDLLSERAFGHTGFTGTSLWVDPEYALIVVLLTNRVHPLRDRGAAEIPGLRASVNNVAAGAIVDG